MANSLGRNIEENEVIVLHKEILLPAYWDLKFRLFRVYGGFGMKSFTAGTALSGEFLCDGEKTRYEGYEISADETEKWQLEFGKFGEKYVKETA